MLLFFCCLLKVEAIHSLWLAPCAGIYDAKNEKLPLLRAAWSARGGSN